MQRGCIHDDGVAFDATIEGEMRSVTGVEDWIVFQDDDGGFNGIEGVAAGFENAPASMKGAKAASFAGINGIVGDVPGAAVNDEGGSHERRG